MEGTRDETEEHRIGYIPGMWWLVACTAGREPVSKAPPVDTGDDVPRGDLAFAFPLADPSFFEQTIGFDHDPTVYEEGAQGVHCINYDGRGFPWCYDEHDGSDYLLEGGFDTMDAGSVEIIAAAPGVVVETDDGHYDRCHATVDGIDCDGYEMIGNHVIIQHEGGWLTKYWHMKQDSVAVAVGDEVECGTVLGKVGSSGYSSMPHLHFEVADADGVAFDPYAGEYSQEETWWIDQGDPEGLPAFGCP